MRVLSPLGILYRGSLTSCNYRCGYCPFRKRSESRAEIENDRAEVRRFTAWAAASERPLSILFTPWGEALVRKAYRGAIVELSHMEHVTAVGAQTNLSMSVRWLEESNRDSVRLWTTFHPSQVAAARFLRRCEELAALGVRFSVGVVGTPEGIEHAELLRRELPADVYVWINALNSGRVPTVPELHARATAVDPLFPLSASAHASRGAACRTGETVVAIDGDGEVRRCWFVKERLGNIYADDLDTMLRPRSCPARGCGCHIGYVHLERLGLAERFGRGLLQRVPDEPALLGAV